MEDVVIGGKRARHNKRVLRFLGRSKATEGVIFCTMEIFKSFLSIRY